MPKTTDLNALTVPAAGDLLIIVDDAAGSPETKKITVANLLGSIGDMVAGGAEDYTVTNVTPDRGGAMSQDTGTESRRDLPPVVTAKIRELYQMLVGPRDQFNLYLEGVFAMAGLDPGEWELAEDGSALVRKEQ
jgi:hypothetical protein